MTLASKQCTTCAADTAPLTTEQATQYLQALRGWNLIEANGLAIECRFAFTNFAKALHFVSRVAELAETENHHPDISFGWGYATIRYTTHKIHGLHENDFIMAARVNDLYHGSSY